MIAFITVGVEPTAPDSPTPLAPNRLVLAGTLSSSWLLKVGKVVARYPRRRKENQGVFYRSNYFQAKYDRVV